jgi:sugar phosphate isomerase/epimerase
MDLFQLVDYCRQHRVPGVELTSYYFPQDVDTAYLKKLRRYCHVQGVSISGGAIRNDFCVAASEREKELAEVRRWLDVYAELGAPVIRIFAGSPAKDSTREEAVQRCIEACEIACEAAGQRGIMLALENHHGITDTAESMLAVVRGVKSPWFGVNFDSGNFHLTADPYAELEMIAPYAVNAQIKVDIVEGGKKVAADLGRIVQILDRAGYSGWVALEYEGAEDANVAIPRHLETLAGMFVGTSR